MRDSEILMTKKSYLHFITNGKSLTLYIEFSLDMLLSIVTIM